ncbi:MAG: flagellar biosynthesis protein FlhA [Gammaproteobacteria bacterium]|nr:flagellar biosynthesis protein FlhA [Gammaproteobacteria bacterium]
MEAVLRSLNITSWQQAGLGAPILLFLMLAMMVVPLPPFMLDMLFTFNISLSLVILLASVYSRRPLDFAVFPTVLLVSTLLRLALNIASTRVVLLHGHTGSAAAGHVIEAFGEFVIGGNYAVGFVVFAILVIINFVVITKGAGRISEVSARFTLDAMPGKQMAIDADLNAGIINQDEARARRQEVGQEADFYGSMDGAGKFVRGDAIAGLLVLVINIVGGIIIGTVNHGMSIGDALRVFTLLTIGDGLVAQIPGLLLSTASAIMVTRVSAASDMGQQVLSQLFDNPRALAVTAGVLGIMGVIPGMPNVAFLSMAGAAGYGAWWIAKRKQGSQQEETVAPPPKPAPESRDLNWEDVLPTDALGLEVGYRLIPLVDRNQGGELLNRLRGVRKKLSQELGFLVPSVHIRDNLDLPPSGYRVSVFGVTVAQAEIQPDRELAINPGQVHGEVQGMAGTDPVFNLPATWIETGQREYAQAMGYTVVDASTVVATHVSQIVQDHAHELLGHEEAQKLLDGLKKSHPRLVEDVTPKLLPLSAIVKVLQNLLREQVPIRDGRTILEVLSEHGTRSQDPGELTAAVRISLGRVIVQQINGLNEELPVMTLAPSLEQLLQKSVQNINGGGIALEPNMAGRLTQTLKEAHQNQEMAGQPSILVVPDNLRDFLARFVRSYIKQMHVLAYSELPDNKQLRIVATIGND